MAKVRINTGGKIAMVVLGLIIISAAVYNFRDTIAPPAQKQASNVPPVANLPDVPDETSKIPPVVESPPGCADKPEVRFYHWAWNSQMGMMLATGGKQATAQSLMCKNGVNLKLIREDNVDTMQSLMMTFADRLKKGDAHPKEGAHFVAIMGDGGAAFFKGINDQLQRLGPEYTAAVVGSAGYSRGEDKFMGPPAWRENPQSAKGGVVAGYLRDGDWNIALKWLGDNGIPNNPDDTTWDPDALNWINASDYIDAAQKYVSNFCTELKHKQTGKKVKKCTDAVVTWTPGDVTVAEQRGGLVSIVSTKEYRSQMPNAIIGNKKWMAANPELVQGMLKAIFDAGDLIKGDDAQLQKAAGISAVVYGEQTPDYWYKYFTLQVQKDKQGLMVELGGSSVNNLADNLQLFGLAPGSTNVFAATYNVFGAIVTSQYPKLVPNYPPIKEVLDTRYVEALAKADTNMAAPDLPTFEATDKVEKVISRKSWNIEFTTGSANFTPAAERDLDALLADLTIAGGTLVEVHGHTDNVGNVDTNTRLSEQRAFAVKQWLEKKAPSAFPGTRTKVFAKGPSEPLAPNDTPENRARNRRVEIIMGTN